VARINRSVRRLGQLAVALAPGAAMASNTASLSDADVALDLNNIRKSLMRMEDSIIFSLIERAQYKINNPVYEPDCTWRSVASWVPVSFHAPLL
jgi:hypothetical protein